MTKTEEIEQLRRRVERLENALDKFVEYYQASDSPQNLWERINIYEVTSHQ